MYKLQKRMNRIQILYSFLSDVSEVEEFSNPDSASSSIFLCDYD